MALEGALEEFGLADILQLIYFQKKTGILIVVGKEDTVKVSLLEGNITGLESKMQKDESKLGRVLIKRELITRGNLDAAMDIQKEENVKLGVVFLRRNLVSQDILTETIKNQITEAIVQVFTWSEGTYEFVPQEVTQDSELPIAIDTQHLLMDGLRTVDEWSLIKGKLDMDTVFKLVREPEPDELNDTEMDVLTLIDGESDVRMIITVSTAGDFDTSRALIALQDKEIIAASVFEAVIEEKKAPITLSEKPVLISTIVIAVIILLFTLKGNFDAYRAFTNSMLVSDNEFIKRGIEIHNITNGGYPDSLSSVTEDTDHWGNPYVYGLKDDGYVFFSKGPDGVEGTDDDIY